MKTSLLSAISAATSLLSMGVMAQSLSSAAAPVDPTAFINQFESTFGKFEGYRRSGAKGICATGEFMGTAAARGLSAASVFSGTNVPVVVHHSGGMKTIQVNQKKAPTISDAFVSLGTFDFEKGKTGKLVISNEGVDGFVIVDAVVWIAK